MMTLYLNQIQSILVQILKHYKESLITKKELDESLDNLEQHFEHHFSEELKEYLNWACVMRLWGVPIMSFVEDGQDFRAWANRAKIIKIHLNKTPENVAPKLEIMWGKFETLQKEEKLFKVFVDVDGNYINNPESVFVIYGFKKPNYPDQFDEDKEINQTLLAQNITDFVQKWLLYLHTLPVPTKHYPKIDKLFDRPQKLFNYVIQYNWDEGQDVIEYIINHPQCDKATALAVYWLSTPYAYDEAIGKDMNMIPFVIEENLRNNFYRDSENHFDPEVSGIGNFIKEYEVAENKNRFVPEFMLQMKV